MAGAGRGIEGRGQVRAVSACQKAAAEQQAPGARSSVPTRRTRCGPGSSGKGGPRMVIRPQVGASGPPGRRLSLRGKLDN